MQASRQFVEQRENALAVALSSSGKGMTVEGPTGFYERQRRCHRQFLLAPVVLRKLPLLVAHTA